MTTNATDQVVVVRTSTNPNVTISTKLKPTDNNNDNNKIEVTESIGGEAGSDDHHSINCSNHQHKQHPAADKVDFDDMNNNITKCQSSCPYHYSNPIIEEMYTLISNGDYIKFLFKLDEGGGNDDPEVFIESNKLFTQYVVRDQLARPNHIILGSDGWIKIWKNLIYRWDGNRNVVLQTILTFLNLSMLPGSYQKFMIRKGIIDIILYILNKYDGDNEIEQLSCAFLESLSTNEKNGLNVKARKTISVIDKMIEYIVIVQQKQQQESETSLVVAARREYYALWILYNLSNQRKRKSPITGKTLFHTIQTIFKEKKELMNIILNLIIRRNNDFNNLQYEEESTVQAAMCLFYNLSCITTTSSGSSSSSSSGSSSSNNSNNNNKNGCTSCNDDDQSSPSSEKEVDDDDPTPWWLSKNFVNSILFTITNFQSSRFLVEAGFGIIANIALKVNFPNNHLTQLVSHTICELILKFQNDKEEKVVNVVVDDEEEEAVTVSGIYAICNLLSHSERRVIMVSTTNVSLIITTLLNSISRFPNNKDIQQFGCESIFYACCHNDHTTKKIFVNEGSINLINRAYDIHVTTSTTTSSTTEQEKKASSLKVKDATLCAMVTLSECSEGATMIVNTVGLIKRLERMLLVETNVDFQSMLQLIIKNSIQLSSSSIEEDSLLLSISNDDDDDETTSTRTFSTTTDGSSSIEERLKNKNYYYLLQSRLSFHLQLQQSINSLKEVKEIVKRFTTTYVP